MYGRRFARPNFLTRNRLNTDEGFTLIELLVVILIVGALAAIAIPSFLNQRQKGQDACAKNHVRTMATAMETWYTERNTYAGVTIGALTSIERGVVANNVCGNLTRSLVGGTVAATGRCAGAATAVAYCVDQTSVSGQTAAGNGTVFTISKVAGAAAVRRCGPAARRGTGGCRVGGVW
jgi:type IV pilus assembly protein PilA